MESDRRRALVTTVAWMLALELSVAIWPMGPTALVGLPVYILWQNVFVLGGRVNPELPLWQIIVVDYGLVALLAVLVHGGIACGIYRMARCITRSPAPLPRICA
jgi:hypothetical protein